MSTSYLLFIPAALLFGSTASYTIDKVESANFLFPVAIYAAMIPYLVVSIVDMIGVSANNALVVHILYVQPLVRMLLIKPWTTSTG